MTPLSTTTAKERVYQFHHEGALHLHPACTSLYQLCLCGDSTYTCIPNFRTTTGATGLEPATSRVTVECSNQTELRPQQHLHLHSER